MQHKKIPFYFFCLVIFACSNNKNPYENNLGIKPEHLAQMDTAHYTLIKWKDTLIDFGTIQMGDSVNVKFKFTNIGSTPLFIFNTRTSCGCTITNFSKDPVMPGKSGIITATYKSGRQSGKINKAITVMANTKNYTNNVLFIRGVVQAVVNKTQ